MKSEAKKTYTQVSKRPSKNVHLEKDHVYKIISKDHRRKITKKKSESSSQKDHLGINISKGRRLKDNLKKIAPKKTTSKSIISKR